jgi:hypothetical protein
MIYKFYKFLINFESTFAVKWYVCNLMCPIMKSTIFWDITPRSPLTALLATCFHAGFFSAYFSTLEMEDIYSSEMSVDVQRTTKRYIPEDGTLHNHRCDKLKS